MDIILFAIALYLYIRYAINNAYLHAWRIEEDRKPINHVFDKGPKKFMAIQTIERAMMAAILFLPMHYDYLTYRGLYYDKWLPVIYSAWFIVCSSLFFSYIFDIKLNRLRGLGDVYVNRSTITSRVPWPIKLLAGIGLVLLALSQQLVINVS